MHEDGRWVYEKTVDSRKHRLRRWNAYAVDLGGVEWLRRQGVGWLRIVERDTGRVLEIPLAHFIARGRRIDLGYGEQIACSVCHWTVVKGGQLGLPLPPADEAAEGVWPS